MSWECSQCEGENDLEPDAEEGQILECVHCGAEFEIEKTEPLALSMISGGAAAEPGAEVDEEPWEE